MVCLAATLFLNSCHPDIAFVTLLRTADETAISEVRKLLRTGGVLTSLTWLFWRWLTVSSVVVGVVGRAIHLYPTPRPLPFPLSLISLMVSADVKHG